MQSDAQALTSTVDYPLYIVTAGVGDDVSGCLAGFVTQCSIAPPRFLVCISKVNHTFGIAIRAKGLAVHVLGSHQRETASLFGEASGDWTDKFSRVAWNEGATGAPVLVECAAWVEGPVLTRLDAGDHEAFLIGVSAGGGVRAKPLMLSDADDLQPGHPA
jgi:flavin reductase (DIM6/NTAB) family NADH-FMN oxidoreductase RutF